MRRPGLQQNQFASILWLRGPICTIRAIAYALLPAVPAAVLVLSFAHAQPDQHPFTAT